MKKTDSKSVKIIFICMGNICRSPAAENALRHLLLGNDIAEKEIIADSAGMISYHTGEAPDSRMQKASHKRGIEMTGTARQVNSQDFYDFDALIGMDNENVSYLKRICPKPELARKIYLFSNFCQEHDIDGIPDPYYGGQDGFDKVIEMVFDGCNGILEQVKSGKFK